jgi:hypothetical protein
MKTCEKYIYKMAQKSRVTDASPFLAGEMRKWRDLKTTGDKTELILEA